MLTYAEAMARVREDYAATWLESHPGGTFHTDPDGYEDGSAYLVPVSDPCGPPMVDDAPAVLVDKVTGGVSHHSPLDILDRMGAMTPISV
ncbi:hypothetical protein [Leifsonia sp. AG29]|uniref:hypothetical protein n=1 Tax=Leifsonia sp. AG29 TaxID=2598860 RepID=UPI00131C5385|nr:hypothetical protein [Leifsonia sp. AG29]